MLLKNASIWYYEQIIQGHILVNEQSGLIEKISQSLSEIGSSNEIIDLKGKLVIPSLVDIHSHLRDFEESHKETYETGALAAASGGFTTIFDMPNKLHPVDCSERLNKAVEKTQQIDKVKIVPFALLTKNTEEALINDYPYFKAYLGITTGEYLTNLTDINDLLNRGAGVLTVHCEDNLRIIANLKLYQDTLENHIKIRDPQTEFLAIKNLLEKTKDVVSKVKLHIAHVTLIESINLLHSRHISFEVTPHHLLLNYNDFSQLGVRGKVNPPLRSKTEQKKLLDSFLRGEIHIIGTDHAPHTIQEKEDFELAGIPGLETCLPLLLNQCKPLDKRKLRLIINALAVNPRYLMNLPEKGVIAVDEPANLTVIDPKKKRKVRGDDLKTKCKWSPWEGVELQGWPVLTINKGKITYNDL
ncbi:MAG: dihydroorotase family protein [Promethearchaeota archaeon]